MHHPTRYQHIKQAPTLANSQKVDLIVEILYKGFEK